MHLVVLLDSVIDRSANHTHSDVPVTGGVISAVNELEALDSPIPYIFSHAQTITPEEEELLRKLGQYVSITPESEMHYGHTHPQAYTVSYSKTNILLNFLSICKDSRSRIFGRRYSFHLLH